MKTLTLLAILVGGIAWAGAQTNEVDAVPTSLLETDAVILSANGDAVILTGELAQRPSRGTFSTYTTTDHSARLNALRELNKPAPPPPAPLVELHVTQQQTTNVRIDRARHDRRLRRPRHYSPNPLP